MATPIINQFTQFQLTDAEALAGQQLSGTQLMVIQNLRAEYSIKKINLNYNPNDHQVYLQQEAELSGWLSCLNYILECNDVATAARLEAASNNDSESSGDSITIFQV